jgi:ribonuclease R
MARRPTARRKSEPVDGLPSPGAILAFLGSSTEPMGAHEIARAFRVAAADEPALRSLLRAIERSGRLTRTAGRKYAAAAALPEITPVERVDTDDEGAPLVRPVSWDGDGEAPVYRLTGATAADELAIGERATARLVTRDSGEIEAELLRQIEVPAGRIVGTFRRRREGAVLIPADRRDRSEYRISPAAAEGAADGELVVAAELPTRRSEAKRARIVERLGSANAPHAISRLTIAAHGIPTEFPPAALAEAAKAVAVDAAGRVDLRGLGLVTIDGSDARDFDDAVWAEPDSDPKNPGGWHLVVAIADVAYYVTPGSALDREAVNRGNSVYFPDLVIPMLPEALSNGLCSLKPGEDRACLAVHLWIDANGRKLRHRFARAVMCSSARLTYEQVQAAREGSGEAPIAADRLDALYGAYAVLDKWRQARGALELDLVEYRVLLDKDGRPSSIVPRTRLDSHKLIEEFMILANVAAAEELEARHLPCMYRVHDAPDPEKLAALRDFLVELGVPGLALAKGQVIRPELFNRVLARAAGTPAARAVNEMVLRSQAQAVYSPNNIGHFGLALPRYAHFTSPIRRYADLLVHRALIASLETGRRRDAAGGEDLAPIGQHISATERRAVAAEREALDRYRATLLANAIGTVFEGRITGVARFGLFVTLAESGSDGLLPISSLAGDYYAYEADRHRLVGRRTDRSFALGDAIRVRLVEADGIGGRLIFGLDEGPIGRPTRTAGERGRSFGKGGFRRGRGPRNQR